MVIVLWVSQSLIEADLRLDWCLFKRYLPFKILGCPAFGMFWSTNRTDGFLKSKHKKKKRKKKVKLIDLSGLSGLTG